MRFEALESPLGWTPELLTGSESAHARLRQARGLYRVAFETPTGSQPTVAVFEALWCARALMEKPHRASCSIVTAYKLHDAEDVVEITELDFDIRDHVNLHAVEAVAGDTPLWVHSHGMEKFGMRDVEIFHLAEEDLLAAESFLHELCTDLAFGQGPARVARRCSNGEGHLHAGALRGGAARDCSAFRWRPSRATRALFLGPWCPPRGGTPPPSCSGRTASRFEQRGPEERTEALRLEAHAPPAGVQGPLPAQGADGAAHLPRARPVRDPPRGRADGGEPLARGALLGGGPRDREAGGRRRADHRVAERRDVEIDEDTVNAVAMGRDGRPLDDEEMQGVLLAERPS